MRPRGFTLIELLISMGILASISVFCITSIATQIEHRNRLEVRHGAYHAMHTAMSKVYDDFRNAYLVVGVLPNNMPKRALVWRPTGQTFYLTTQNYHSFNANSHESSMAQVRYEIRPSEGSPDKKELWRIVDTEWKDSIELKDVGIPQKLVDDLVKFQVEFWNGTDWTRDGDWDTTQGETSQRLPKMAKIRLEGNMPETSMQEQKRQLSNPGSTYEPEKIVLETIVYILRSADMAQLKEPSSSGYLWR